jgi:radical SAM superfamily enzyme YgiQ (UPF0313 family)
VKKDKPHILLINPWIHDFAAYDFWAKPIGLLYLASILRDHGYKVSYIDCLDRFHPAAPKSDPHARDGRGPFFKTRIAKPKALKNIPRNYSRYGIPEKWFRKDLESLKKPVLLLVTSLMTYWYPGVQETIRIIREYFGDVPLILGGIYATLCHDHAIEHSGADKIFTGAGEEHILKLVGAQSGFPVKPKFDPEDPDSFPYPALDLQHKINYAPILTSRGCPFTCTYCASHILHPKRILRDPMSVVGEIQFWHKNHGVYDFVFYDDALLVDAERHAIPILEKILQAGLKIRFHTPNAVHIRSISKHTACLMKDTGFKTIRLGLESANFGNRDGFDYKVTSAEFKRAVRFLIEAGFEKYQVGAYLLAGLPNQSLSTLTDSIAIVKQAGITPVLAYYSPIPKTALWPEAVACSPYDLESDPIYTNNAIFPCDSGKFSWETITYLKNLAAA